MTLGRREFLLIFELTCTSGFRCIDILTCRRESCLCQQFFAHPLAFATSRASSLQLNSRRFLHFFALGEGLSTASTVSSYSHSRRRQSHVHQGWIRARFRQFWARPREARSLTGRNTTLRLSVASIRESFDPGNGRACVPPTNTTETLRFQTCFCSGVVKG